MKLSIIIPAYNEEKTLGAILSRVLAVDLAACGVEKEIIVVDDCSTDGTYTLAKKYVGVTVLRNERNLGKGGAVRKGFKRASGDILLVQDADLEYDPEEYKKLLEPMINGGADVVYGSRYLARCQNTGRPSFWQPMHAGAYSLAYLGNRIVTSATNLLFFSELTDEATCYKVFRKNVLEGINIKGNGFEWEPEVTAKLLKKGWRIVEVPISYHPRTFEEGKKINWRDGVKALYTLAKYRLFS